MTPSRSLYVAALEAIARKGLPPSWKNLLRSHYAAPRHTTSMNLLARAVGYRNYSAANLNYGRLSARIGKLVGLPPRANYVNLYAVATWNQWEPDEAGHFTFTMRPQLASALKQLRWIRGAHPPADNGDPVSFVEGKSRQRLVRHLHREKRLRDLKLREALEGSLDGRLSCEVPGCGFDFEAAYGALGHGYAEVHHLVPLSGRPGVRRTSTSDLAVVCANCHAMIHRFGGSRPLSKLVRRAPQARRGARASGG